MDTLKPISLDEPRVWPHFTRYVGKSLSYTSAALRSSGPRRKGIICLSVSGLHRPYGANISKRLGGCGRDADPVTNRKFMDNELTDSPDPASFPRLPASETHHIAAHRDRYSVLVISDKFGRGQALLCYRTGPDVPSELWRIEPLTQLQGAHKLQIQRLHVDR